MRTYCTRPIGVGLIGYGVAGSVFHAPLIDSVADLHLLAAVTRQCERVARERPGVRVTSAVEEMLADPAIELVVVASPTAAHFENARAALLAGKHVVVDKPMAVTVDEAEALMDLAASKKRVLSVFQNRRWDNDFRTVKQCIQQGWLGQVYFYEAHYDRFRPAIKPGWREKPLPGSGILYDLGSHLIDQALHLFGLPQAVTADVFAQRAEAQVDDYFHLVLHYGNSRVILHSATLAREPGPRFAVHGDGGSFLKYGIDGQEQLLRSGEGPNSPGWGSDLPENYGVLTLSDGTQRKVETLPGAYEKYYESMAECLLSGGSIPVNATDARDGLRVIEGARRSASERRTLHFR